MLVFFNSFLFESCPLLSQCINMYIYIDASLLASNHVIYQFSLLFLYIYIYIYIKKEKKRERKRFV